VLWHAPEAPPTAELTSLLVQRGVTLETCSNPYAAAARVCRLERAARARQCPGDEEFADEPRPLSAPGLVLLLAEPARLPMREALARVLELHAPRTICWVYEQADGPRLRPVQIGQIGVCASGGPGDTEMAPPPAPKAPLDPPASRPPARLSLAPSDTRLPASEAAPAGRSSSQVPINTGSVLTDEELAMLLADGDDPAPRHERTSSQEPPRSHRP
jgi:hypothetical protein